MNLFPALPAALALLLTAAPADEAEIKPARVIHLDAGQTSKILNSPDKKKKPIIIDIRTLGEFKAGHLQGAVHIDFLAESFSTKIGKLNRNTSYLVHCQSGGRSSNSLALWKTLGFEKIYHLDGGLLAWKKAGLPIVK
tara:strand:+ start:1570 stop:1983 length:414 start_codon:yes stop_codon:yes gene_type:complete